MRKMNGFHGLCVLVLYVRLASAGSGGPDDFSSNLFSDIAPLIALFGEQVAKQYLSQSLGWLENLIFACAPLGIITAITCAIRVGGPVALRALIGRSQEPSIQVELDLLRSTSSDVCELWDGNQVVRLAGTPEILELVFDQDGAIHGRDDMMKPLPQRSIWSRYLPAKLQYGDIELSDLSQHLNQDYSAPNVSINGGSIHPMELRLVAVVAVVLQLGVVVFNVFSVYNSRLSLAISPDNTPAAGLPLTVSGIVAVSLGVFICAWVIEARTRIVHWVPKDKSQDLHILWLQKAQVLNDQHFRSCAIFADHNRQEIVASQVDWRKNLAPWAVLGTVVTSIGFICQLIGVRTMHYSAAVSQFVATIIMILLRALIRRHYTRQPIVKKTKSSPQNSSEKVEPDPSRPLNTFGIVELAENHELNEISKQISGCKEWFISNDSTSEEFILEEFDHNSMAQIVLRNRLKLQELCRGFWSADSVPLAQNLGSRMNSIFNHIWANRVDSETEIGTIESFKWEVNIATSDGMGSSFTKLPIQFLRSGQEWQVDSNALEAILGMWLSQLSDWGCQGAGVNLWLLSLDSEDQIAYAQILYKLLLPESRSPIITANVQEYCTNHEINDRRVHSISNFRNNLTAYATRIGFMNQTSVEEMCRSLLLVSFIAQVASFASAENQKATLTMDSHGNLQIHYPLFKFLSDTYHTGLSSEDMEMIAFIGLCQARKLPDPLHSLRAIIEAAVSQPKDYASKTSARICQLFTQQHKSLLRRCLFDEAEELSLKVNGTFAEVLGHANAETLKVRKLAKSLNTHVNANHPLQLTTQQEPCLDPESHHDSGLGQTSVASREDTPSLSQSNHDQGRGQSDTIAQTDQTIVSQDTYTEESLNSYIKVGDVASVRRCLLMMDIDEKAGLYMSLLTASHQVNAECTISGTEIIRLLILSGSGVETYRFRPSSLLCFAAKCGNLRLLELLLQRAANEGRDYGGVLALRTAVELGHEAIIAALLASGLSVDAQDDMEGTNALHTAARHGKLEIAKQLVAAGASIRLESKYGLTALGIAALRNHDDLGKYLIEIELEESSKSIDTRGVGFLYSRAQSSLHAVSGVGNTNLAKVLLDSGWDVNGVSTLCTPLSCAIRDGHEDTAALLLERGSRVDPEQLHSAAQKGLFETAKLLLNHGAAVDAYNYFKETPLIVTAGDSGTPKDGQLDVVRLLIDHNANVNAIDREGENALLLASDKGYEQLAILLINHGVSLDDKRKDGSAAIHSAAHHGNLSLVEELVKKGAKLDTLNKNQETALHIAAKNGHGEIIRALLKAQPGDWVNWKSEDYKGYTPLHLTIYSGHVDAARALLDNGADVNSSTKHYAGSPLVGAVEASQAGLVQLFMERGATMTIERRQEIARVAEDAIDKGDLEIIRHLFTNDAANPPKGKKSQATLLIPRAARSGKLEVVNLLLELGADISDGKALKLAASSGKSDIVKVLVGRNPQASLPLGSELFLRAASANDVDTMEFWLNSGVPIDCCNNTSQTAVHVTAAGGKMKSLTFLLDRNSSSDLIDLRDKYGDTALHAAIQSAALEVPYSNLNVVKLLVERGANRTIRNGRYESWQQDKGRTPLALALSRDCSAIADFLEEADEKEGIVTKV